jgi:thioredoxin 1
MEISTKELREKIKNGEKLLIDFYGTFCGPCKVMKPMFESVSNTLKEAKSDVQLYTFNIENDRELISELGIRSVPTIKGFSGGKEVFSEIGLKQTNLIMEMTKKLL